MKLTTPAAVDGRAPLSSSTRLACPDCGGLQRLPPMRRGLAAECRYCHRLLARPRLLSRDATLAVLLAALLLWFPASLATLMLVASSGAVRTAAITTGAHTLWQSGFAVLALVVLLFVFIVPWLYFGLITYVLFALRQGRSTAAPAQAPGGPLALGQLLRWTQQLRPWVMIEVFLLGGCVAYSRIEQVAYVSVETAGWCLIATTLLLLLGLAELDQHELWEAVAARRPRQRPTQGTSRQRPARAAPAPVWRELACLACDTLVPNARAGDHCPLCRAALYPRKPYSVERATALALCGLLLYVPANVLPMLSLERLGHEEPNTILSGVLELAQLGLWPLAVLVFVASILIPLAKLIVLGLNLWLLRRRSARGLVLRTRLHRAVDAVGRWSNIDIFTLSLLVALVQFGNLEHVHAQAGAVAFAGVVVVTMLATKAFDTRLMWDAAGVRR